MSIAAGAKAPDFTMKTDGNGTVAFAKLKGRNVVRRVWRKVRVSGHVGEVLAAVKALCAAAVATVASDFNAWPHRSSSS